MGNIHLATVFRSAKQVDWLVLLSNILRRALGFRMVAAPVRSDATRCRFDRFTSMANKKIYEQPSSVTAHDGDVLVVGPDDVDVGLTPDAAEETSNRLLEGSMKARGQRRLKDYPHRAK
jgi:hypothetical protein